MKRAKQMPDNKCSETPFIVLTANAILGAREMYINEGFLDYISKPIDGMELEAVLQKYIPDELIEKGDSEEKGEEEGEDGQEKSFCGKYIDLSIGMQYSAGSDEMYRQFLQMYCSMKEERIENLEESFQSQDWKNYTVYVHAMKSTSLSIGGKALSELAAKLEQAGKKDEVDFILQNHKKLMELYELTIEEGEQYLSS